VATWRGNAKDARSFAPIMLANRIYTPADPSVGYQDRIDLIYN